LSGWRKIDAISCVRGKGGWNLVSLSGNHTEETTIPLQVSNPVPDAKNKIMRSKTVERLLAEMAKDPWYVKLRRWWNVKMWTYKCLTRKYWDKSFSGYIFKKKS
jgi:hypothetical protein